MIKKNRPIYLSLFVIIVIILPYGPKVDQTSRTQCPTLKRKRKILMSLEKKDASSFAGALGGSSRVPSSHQESEGDTLPRAHRGGPRFAFFVSR